VIGYYQFNEEKFSNALKDINSIDQKKQGSVRFGIRRVYY
jgi:hypothetical protein